LSADRAILIVPYGRDPLASLATRLLVSHRQQFSDLTRHTVLLPQSSVQHFQRSLLQQTDILLPPTIASLENALRQYAPAHGVLTTQQRELLLFDVLSRFPGLIARYGTWQLIDGLLALFDQITLNIPALPATLDEFQTRLARGYGLPPASRFSALSTEAALVHSVYRAWQEYLDQENYIDSAAAQVAAMRASLDHVRADAHVYVAGVADWTHSALDWLKRLPCPVTVVLQGALNAQGYHPDSIVSTLVDELDWHIEPIAHHSARTVFLSSVYAVDGAPMAKRAAQARAGLATDPLVDHLSIFHATDGEQEARAVELQVRRWWLAGSRDIGVISNDRKLLRRVRALLERAQLPLLDRSGWPLSTTSAASAIMNWLLCISSAFATEPLLDFIRSPFVTMKLDAFARHSAIAVIETALTRVRSAPRGLEACATMLERHTEEMDTRFGPDASTVAREMLKGLQSAAAPLLALHQRRTISYAQFCRALGASLQALGMAELYNDDEAGRQLLALLEELTLSASAIASTAGWEECVHWLRRTLERRHFRPLATGAGVELASFADATLGHYEALVLAGCTADHLPAADDTSPFFNDAVRGELGLRTNAYARNVQFNTFRRLLEAANEVLLTYRGHDGSRPMTVSPWVERLQAFHNLAFGDAATDPTLIALLADARTLLSHRDSAPPAPAVPPHPAVPAGLIPTRLTASGYQSLVDCPYQFFTRTVLGLERPRPLEEELAPADYGMLVHRCLQAFHEGVAGLPGPWQGPLTETQLHAAHTLLEDIAAAVFAPHLRRTITTRAWLYRWQNSATAYLRWQLEHQQRWRTSHCEQSRERALSVGDRPLQLWGRIDRIDEATDAQAIIDYKTGTLPKRNEIARGEHVQLPFYALLAPAAGEARLLGFEDEAINDRIVLTGDELHGLSGQHEQRLVRLFDDIEQGAPLPAHGDPETCDRCAVATLCRRPLWQLAATPKDESVDDGHD